MPLGIHSPRRELPDLACDQLVSRILNVRIPAATLAGFIGIEESKSGPLDRPPIDVPAR